MTITPFVATPSSPHRGMTQPPLPVREEKRAGELERERSELAFEERERERERESYESFVSLDFVLSLWGGFQMFFFLL